MAYTYGTSNYSANGLSATALCDIETSAADSVRLMDVEHRQAVGVGTTQIGLGRPANTPVGIGPIGFIADDPGSNVPAARTFLFTNWSTAPTVPAAFFRRYSTTSVVGTGVLWTWPQGLAVAPSAGLVLWNITGGSPLYSQWEIEEG